MRKILLLCFTLLFAVGISNSWAQERTVSGKVTSIENGDPLPGVNVVLKGTTAGTVTDIDGNYRVSVPSDGGILVFSFIGLASEEITIGSRSVIDLQMSPDVQQLSEVVVTAIGIEQDSRRLGYSVEKLDASKVQGVSEPDALRAMQGKVAGVNIVGSSGTPGASTRITIRGNSSLLGNNQPLFVVDGVPYNNDYIGSNGVNSQIGGLSGGGAFGSRIADLDPNNIESLTVLKGAAAAALYGSRAGNGVILITTKTGSTKSSNKGLEVALNSSFSIEQIAKLPDYQNKYGTGTRFAYQQANGSWGAPFPGTVPYQTIDEIDHWYNGSGTWPGTFDGVTVPYQAYPDNVEDFFETGKVYDNSVTVSGGNAKSNLGVTLSHLKNEGYIPNAEFTRYNISVGGRTQLDNGLNIGGNIALTQSSQTGPITGAGTLGASNPSLFARLLLLGRNWDLHGQPFQSPVDNGSEFMVGRGNANNPYWSVANTGVTAETDRWAASFDASYDIGENFTINGRMGLNTYSNRTTEFQRPNGAGAGANEGLFIETFATNTEINTDFFISYNKELNEDFSLRALVGNNINDRKANLQQYQGTGYAIFDIDDADNLSNVIASGGDFSRRRIVGFYGDASLTFRDWATLGITARNDYSSTLPEDNRSFFYPSVTGSVILSDALGIQSSAVSLIKLRGAWSQVGNDTGPYQLAPVFVLNNSNPNNLAKPFNGTSSATLSNIGRDPNLKPEITTEIELGAQIGLLKDRVGIDFTYYDKVSKDQIAQIATPEETGFSAINTNVGEISNKGIELTLNTTPLLLENGFKWDVLVTFTRNRNKIEELNNVDFLEFGSSFSGNVRPRHVAGQPYGLLFGNVAMRDEVGNLLIDPNNGQLITDPVLKTIGDPNPDFLMGITSTFSFKGISLSAVFDYRRGGDVFDNNLSDLLGRGVLEHQGDRESLRVINGVYGDPQTLEPILDENGQTIQNGIAIEVNDLYFGNTFAANGMAEFAVWDATTYRLREVALSYTFPKNLLEKTPFGSAMISFTGRNLWYYTPNAPEDSNWDFERSQFGGQSNATGINFFGIPSTKRYGVNLRVTL